MRPGVQAAYKEQKEEGRSPHTWSEKYCAVGCVIADVGGTTNTGLHRSWPCLDPTAPLWQTAA